MAEEFWIHSIEQAWLEFIDLGGLFLVQIMRSIEKFLDDLMT
jgi:hypothetical protein